MKLLSISLTLLFFWSNVVLAYAPQVNFWKQRGEKVKQLDFAPLPSFPLSSLSHTLTETRQSNQPESHIATNLPSAYGRVENVTRPTSGKQERVVILLQDVHMNHEAQKNISATVRDLIAKKEIDFVGLEGAFGSFPIVPARSFPDRGIVTAVSDFLLEKNKISGPIHALLSVSNEPVPLAEGIDSPQLYASNVEAYRKAIPLQKQKQAEIEQKIKKNAFEKKAGFNSSLLSYDEKVGNFRQGQLGMGEFISHLSNVVPDVESPVDAFLMAYQLEVSLDADQIARQQSRLMQLLVKNLSENELRNLVAQSQRLRSGELDHSEFYAWLTRVCQNKGISLDAFPILDSYIRYNLLVDQIQAEDLMRAVERMIRKGYETLAITQAERDLVAQSDILYLAERLVRFSLTPSEWNSYKALVAAYPVADGLKWFEEFYRAAEARNQAMVDNVVEAMASQGAKKALLVAGGFHTPGMREQLKRAEVASVTFSPKITEIKHEEGSIALSVFTQKKTPFEELFDGKKLFLAHHPGPRSAFAWFASLAVVKGFGRYSFKTLADYFQSVTRRALLRLQKINPLTYVLSLTKQTLRVVLNKDGSMTLPTAQPLRGTYDVWLPRLARWFPRWFPRLSSANQQRVIQLAISWWVEWDWAVNPIRFVLRRHDNRELDKVVLRFVGTLVIFSSFWSLLIIGVLWGAFAQMILLAVTWAAFSHLLFSAAFPEAALTTGVAEAHRYAASQVKELREWLKVHVEDRLTSDELDHFFQSTLLPLMKILKSNPSSRKWTEETWYAYQKYGRSYKEDTVRKFWDVASTADYLIGQDGYPRANKITLMHLITSDRMLTKIRRLLISEIDKDVLKSYMASIHNKGWFEGQLARTHNSIDVLLPVDQDGHMPHHGYIERGGRRIDVLTPQGREKYNRYTQHLEPGVLKLTLDDFQVRTATERNYVEQYFKTAGKSVGSPMKGIQASQRKRLKAFLQQPSRSLQAVTVFNGFVRPWEDLVDSIDQHPEENGVRKEYEAHLLSKQEDALAAALLIFNVPSVFADALSTGKKSVRDRHREQTSLALNVLWRVSRADIPWQNPLIQSGYTQISREKTQSDETIWRTLWNEFLANLNLLSVKQVKSISSSIYSVYEGDKKVEKSPDQLRTELTSAGVHIQGVVTSSGRGIHPEDRPKAKEALKREWRHLPKNTIIVSGATGNETMGNLSGVDLAYEVAEEMGFKTMGVMSLNGFDYPIRRLDYTIVKGMGWGDESDIFFKMIDGLTGFTGGGQAAHEYSDFMDLLDSRDVSKYANLTLIYGIRAFLADKEGKLTGSLDDEELIKKVLNRNGWVLDFGPDGTLRINGKQQPQQSARSVDASFLDRSLIIHQEWLTRISDGQLNIDDFGHFYSEILIPLMEIIETKVGSNQLNEVTWKAFQSFSPQDSLDEVVSRHPTANRETLALLLEASRFLAKVSENVINNMSVNELEMFAKNIHDTGYYKENLDRTGDQTSLLLPVESGGGLKSDGYYRDGAGGTVYDLLTPEARKKYDNRYEKPGDGSIARLTLLDFKQRSDREKGRLLDYFRQNGKDPSALRAQLASPNRGHLVVFNGFVRPWDELLQEAESRFKGRHVSAQKAFLYNRQKRGLSPAFTLYLIPNLFARFMKETATHVFADAAEEMVLGMHTLWRVSSPEKSWTDPLINRPFNKIRKSELGSDKSMIALLFSEFYLIISRFPEEIRKRMANSVLSIFHNQTLVANHTIDSYRQHLNQNGDYEIVGILWEDGISLNVGEVDRVRAALRETFKKVKSDKVLIVASGVGHTTQGKFPLSELAFQVAEELDLTTMGFVNASNVRGPLRRVNHRLIESRSSDRTIENIIDVSDQLVHFVELMPKTEPLIEYVGKQRRTGAGKIHISLVQGIRELADAQARRNVERVRDLVVEHGWGTVFKVDTNENVTTTHNPRRGVAMWFEFAGYDRLAARVEHFVANGLVPGLVYLTLFGFSLPSSPMTLIWLPISAAVTMYFVHLSRLFWGWDRWQALIDPVVLLVTGLTFVAAAPLLFLTLNLSGSLLFSLALTGIVGVIHHRINTRENVVSPISLNRTDEFNLYRSRGLIRAAKKGNKQAQQLLAHNPMNVASLLSNKRLKLLVRDGDVGALETLFLKYRNQIKVKEITLIPVEGTDLEPFGQLVSRFSEINIQVKSEYAVQLYPGSDLINPHSLEASLQQFDQPNLEDSILAYSVGLRMGALEFDLSEISTLNYIKVVNLKDLISLSETRVIPLGLLLTVARTISIQA